MDNKLKAQEPIKACKCGSTDFEVNERIVHKASISPEDGKLDAYKVKTNAIENIFCAKCKKEYGESNFRGIDFC